MSKDMSIFISSRLRQDSPEGLHAQVGEFLEMFGRLVGVDAVECFDLCLARYAKMAVKSRPPILTGRTEPAERDSTRLRVAFGGWESKTDIPLR